MRQIGKIKTGLENLDIKPGDVVHLSQPFRPDRYSSREYTFAIVAGIVKGSEEACKHQSYSDCESAAQEQLPGRDGVVAYLYEPYSSTLYTDQYNSLALFSFDSHEVEILRRGEGE